MLNLKYFTKIFRKARIIHIVRNPIDVAISLKIWQENIEKNVNWSITNVFKAKYFNRRLFLRVWSLDISYEIAL